MFNTLLLNLLAGLVTLIVAATTFFYIYLRKKYKYFHELGVPGPKPVMLFGNMKSNFTLEETDSELVDKISRMYPNDKYIGIYNLWKPTLITKDIELVKNIFEKDFWYFSNHPDVSSQEGSDGVMSSLFFQKGAIWKSRRQILTGLFSPRRLKDYVGDFKRTISSLLQNLETHSQRKDDVDLTSFLDGHSTCFITSAFFNMDITGDMELQQKFCDLGDIFSHPPKKTVIMFLFYTVAPRLSNLLRLKTFPPVLWEFYSWLTKRLLDSRDRLNDQRNDLISLLKKLMEDGTSDGEKIEFREAVAHVYIMFLGAHHTSMLTICHTLHQLSIHPQIQENVYHELGQILEGKKDITYDDLGKMTYLDSCIKEVLRLYPLLGVIRRVCTKPYKLNDTFTIPVGMEIFIPVLNLHRDPNYFSDPDVYRPERFLHSGEKNNPAYMPFGKGPRICIGARFAEVMIKLFLAHVLRNYEVQPSEKMLLPMKFDPKTLFISNRPVKGIWATFKKRESTQSS